MRKLLSRAAALAAVSSLALVAPTFTPVIAPISSSAYASVCGVPLTQATFGSAYAGETIIPCPVKGAPTPWLLVGAFAGVVSVFANAAYVWSTQCRELTSQEALTSLTLPGLGILFDGKTSKCH